MTPYGPERAVTRIAGVQAVLFDTFGAVVDWRSGVTASVQQTADIHHVPLDAAAFADAWRANYEPSMRPIRTGDRPFTRLSRLHRENLTATLAEFGLDITPNEVDRLNHAWQRLAPWPDSVEGLRLLKQRYIIGPLSNGDTALHTRLAKYASLSWDVIIGADLTRRYKPQPEAYFRAAAILDLAPSAVMLVAAQNYDLAVARQAAWQPVSSLAPRSTAQARRLISIASESSATASAAASSIGSLIRWAFATVTPRPGRGRSAHCWTWAIRYVRPS